MIRSRLSAGKNARFKSRRRRILESLEPRCLLASLGGEVFLDSDGDGQRGAAEVGAASIRVYLDANDNSQFDGSELSTTTDAMGDYLFAGVAPGSHTVRILTPGTAQSSPRAFFGTGFPVVGDGSGTNPTQLYEMGIDGEVLLIGSPTTERIHGLVRTNDGSFLGVNFNTDGVYRIDPSTGQETLLSLPGVELAAGLAYDPGTDTVYALAQGSLFGFVQLHTVDKVTGQLSAPLGAGLGGLDAVSDLTFDTVNNRLVGFDNSDDEFFSFGTDGFGAFLSNADRPLQSWSLAFDGSTYVMFDGNDPSGTTTITVDPDTGVTGPSFSTSQRIPSEALFHAKIGDIAHRVTVGANDDLLDLDFGVLGDPPIGLPQPDPGLFINELLVEPTLGSVDTDQYVELRGPLGGTVPADTYLVVVDESNAQAGEIQGIFDLSNQPLGVNGFLVLLQQDSLHSVDPASALLESTMPGFGGLPDSIYTDNDATSDKIAVGANTYFLVQSGAPPQLGADIDTDNNGFADPGGVSSNWTVLDSVSLQPARDNATQAYGDVVLRQLGSASNNVTVQNGVEVVLGPGYGYAGRIGDSFRSRGEDWVFGGAVEATQDEATLRTLVYQFDRGVATPMPTAFHGRDLDHIGESNFNGGVHGNVTLLPGVDANGIPLPAVPATGVTIFADLNGNGDRDLVNFVVDPDDGIDPGNLFDIAGNPIPQVINNAYPGVSISATTNTNQILGLDVLAERESRFSFFGNNRIFAAGIFDYFPNDQRLRFDFYRPVQSVSIEAFGQRGSFMAGYGRLEAYNANDQLIGFVRSGVLVSTLRETITFESANEDIAYAVAYADESFGNGVPFVRFDNFAFAQSEANAVTDAEGVYEIKDLFAANYGVGVLREGQALIGGDPVPIVVTENENYDVDFVLRQNQAPMVDETFLFSIDENSNRNTSIGVITATDPDDQPLAYAIEGPDFGLRLNQNTGELTVGPNADLNFEEDAELVLTVSVTDPFDFVDTTEVTVQLRDVNEDPVVIVGNLEVEEGTPNGSAIGQIQAFDPDFAQDQTLSYGVIGGTGAGTFLVDPNSGLITLADQSAIDFEAVRSLSLVVRVADDFSPAGQTIFVQDIEIVDQNDAPTITTNGIAVPENSRGVVGQLEVSDADTAQTHAFELTGGSGEDLFDVLRDGSVVVREGASLDFEGASNIYSLLVTAIDNGAPPLASEKTIIVSITDVNEPPLISPDEASIGENAAPGSLVSTVVAVDPEGVGTGYVIALLDEGDADNYEFDADTGRLTVADGASINFEVDPIETLRFEISDPSGDDLTSRLPFTISLLDENDAPILITESVIVSELAVPGSPVGQVEVQVREEDTLDSVTVTVVGGSASSLFDLDPQTRVLTVAAGATFDADVDGESLVLDVQVADDKGLSSLGSILIELNDVNEPPVFTNTLPSIDPVGSGEPVHLVIPADLIVDPEGREFSLAVFDENDSLPDWLVFDQATRTLSGLPDPSDVGSFPLTLRAFEPGPLELFNDVHFTIVVEEGETPLTNQRDRLDVDANGDVASLDAVQVINFIGLYGSGANVEDFLGDDFPGFVDVSGNGFVTALDALLVINGIGEEDLGGLLDGLVVDDDDETNDAALNQLLEESSLF